MWTVKKPPTVDRHFPVFGRAIHSLSKIGEELYIEPLDHGLALRTVSSSRSAYACFLFAPSFFQHYDDGAADLDTQDSDDSLRCKIAMKSILTVFKSLSTMEKTVERCKIKLNMTDARLIFQLHCRHGIVKTHNLAFIECETLQAVFSKDMCPNSLTASAKLLTDAVLNFQNNQEEVTVIVNPEKIILKNYVDDEPDPNKVMHTNLRLDPDEFDNCHIGVDTEVTFCLKELRAILAFVEVTTQPLTLHFETGGKPIVFSINSDSTFEANFVLATLADQQTQSQAPSQARLTQKRPSKSSSKPTLNRVAAPRMKSGGDNEESQQNSRLKGQQTDRSERLEAAYDELMDDDDFDEMIIDNQTTICVDKTPVHTSTTSRTHTSTSQTHTSASRISENISSERKGRNFERQNIDGRGDHSKSGFDSRIPRPQSPVAGTSKDDSESPVIPVVHPGTKTPKMLIQDLNDDEEEDEVPGTPPAKRFRSLFFGASQASTQSQTQRTTSAQLSTSRVLAEDTDDED